MISKSKSSLKLGISKYALSNSNNKPNKKDINYGKYPNGLMPFILLILLWVAISLIGILATKLDWRDALSISSSIVFLLNICWLIMRQNFNAKSRYSIKFYVNKLRLNRLKITEPFYDDNYAINKVSNCNEYKEYLNERVKRTSLFFYISLSLHSVLFVIFLIVILIYYYN